MKFENYESRMTLDGRSIDAFSEKIESSLTALKMERQNRLRIRLSMEEALLRMRDHYGEEKEVSVMIIKRFGKVIIEVDNEGPPFNPLSGEEYELQELLSSLITAIGLSPQYEFTGRVGTLKITVPVSEFTPMMQILISILGGTVIGLLGLFVISEAQRLLFTEFVMTPLYDIWSRILNVISGPVIFFMVITTALNADWIENRGGNARKILGRYFALSIIMGAAALIAGRVVFPFEYIGEFSWQDFAATLEMIKDLFPENIFLPFMESNTPQLLFLAIILGSAINVIGSPVRGLKKIIRQINMVGLQLTNWVSLMVPFFAGVLLGLKIWQQGADVLWALVKCLAASFLVSIICMFVVALLTAARENMSVNRLILKTLEPFLLAIKFGTLEASYGQAEEGCIRKLGLERGFTTRSLPNGLVLYMPVSVIGTLIFIAYASMEYGVQITPIWFLLAALLAVILFVATPPVPGANLLAYVVLFARMGIPGIALIDAMIFDILFGIFASAGNQMLLQFELVLQADKLGLLNKKILQQK